MSHLKRLIYLVVLLNASQAFSQSLTQNIRGNVIDKISKSPLPGATIYLVGSDPIIGTTSDMDGNFKLTKVSIGTHTDQYFLCRV
jgi:hypothetical protein